MRYLTIATATLAVSAFVPASGAAAQEPPQPPAADTTVQARDTVPAVDLVFEREVFDYPTFERRNPFRPLLAEETGPRFQDMVLRGILYYEENPSESVAVMGAEGSVVPAGPEGGAGEVAVLSRRLRPGQRWGNVRVLEVRRREVLVEVEEFGLTEQRIMRLPTRRQGGS